MNFENLSSLIDLQEIIESPIGEANQPDGWHVVVNTRSGILGGGVNQDKNIARRIAISEVLERKYFRELMESNDKISFHLNEFPTTCGFAAGFDLEKTRLRSISEALERWAWSKWIDDGYLIPAVNIHNSNLSKISQSLKSNFDEVLFFERSIGIDSISSFPSYVKLGIVVGIKNGGAFPGSRVTSMNEDPWEHSFVEAYRHLLIYRNRMNLLENPFPFNRIAFFGKNASSALSQIKRASKIVWPGPSLLMEKRYWPEDNKIIVYRSLMNDFVGWDKGNVDRFVY